MLPRLMMSARLLLLLSLVAAGATILCRDGTLQQRSNMLIYLLSILITRELNVI